MARVVLYTTPYCGHCFLARALLRRRGIAFDDVDLSADPERRRALMAQTGHRTVPLVFIDGRFIGGRHELAALDSAGELEKLGLAV